MKLQHEMSSDEEALQTITMASPAISNRTGIMQGYSELMIEPNDPRLFHINATIAETSRIWSRSATNFNGGSGLTEVVARASAIGESIERYCLSYYEPSHFIFSNSSELQKKGLEVSDPYTFALFSECQYSKKNFLFKKFTPTSEINWVWGYSLIRKEPVLVPASLVYIPYFKESREHLIGYPVSTGTACARSVEEAILKGIYEVVERDAFMIVWLNRLACPLMNLYDDNDLSRIFAERFLPTRLKFFVLNISLDINIPVMMGIIIDEVTEGLAVAVGAAANLSSQKAALKALIEASQTRMGLKYMKLTHKDNKVFRDDFKDILTFDDHVSYYGQKNSIPHIKFLLDSPHLQDFKDEPPEHMPIKALDHCISMFSSRNLDIIAIDITTDDVLNLGFHVIKVLIPHMQNLNANYNYPFLGGNRLYDVPKMTGYSNQQTHESDMNLYPHPFP